MKPYPEDIIWNTITYQAREKFDYAGFCKTFGPLNNDRVLDNMLFQIMDGFAEGQSSETIADHIKQDFSLLSYSFAGDDFVPFVLNCGELFKTEIEAITLALVLFRENREIADILLKVKQSLAETSG